MIVDTSVLLHILFEEPGWQASVSILLQHEPRYKSVASFIESQAVITNRGIGGPQNAKRVLDTLNTTLGIDLIPLSITQAHIARNAYLTYGKGQGHPAQLNCGNVMTYALAKDHNDILAFVGDNHTDLSVLRLLVAT